MDLAIGIDLGTTYSAIAWVDPDGDPQVIPNALGEPLTPSVVSFGADGVPVVGSEAKVDQADGAPVAHLFKRMMGTPGFQVEFGGREWTAVQLSTLVLRHLKEQAEAALGHKVTRAVITVPEYFTHPERAATLQAGEEAGLEVLRLMSEPTAAALAYGLRPAAETRVVLVYDLGGGTFDLSLVEIGATEITVIASEGDHELGGRDWDDRLAGLILRSLDPGDAELLSEDPSALLVEVEKLKRTLSARRSGEVRVTVGGRTVRAEVTREAFEAATLDLLEQTGQLAAKLFEDATGVMREQDRLRADEELTWSSLTGVLTVGGSTRMPMVQEWIERQSGRRPMGGVHPDQAVALGAAAQAALLLEGRAAEGLLRLPGAVEPATAPILRLGGPRQVNNVVAHSLGMIAVDADGEAYLNTVLLPRNQRVPSTATRPYKFRLRGDGNDLLEVFLTQGDGDSVVDCAYLGRYAVTGFPEAGERPVVVEITYTYNDNVMVDVTAIERGSEAALDVEVEKLPPDVPGRFLEPPPRQAGRPPMTVYLAFDVSGSMSGQPLAKAKQAAQEFLSQLDLTTTAVGLIAFSDRVHVDLKASHNAADITRAIRGMTVASTGGGNFGQPFDALFEQLKGLEQHRRVAVVLADGVWEHQDRARRRASACHQDGIDVFAVGFGSADEVFLRDIASSHELGLFVKLGELSDVFGTIAREITEAGARA